MKSDARVGGNLGKQHALSWRRISLMHQAASPRSPHPALWSPFRVAAVALVLAFVGFGVTDAVAANAQYYRYILSTCCSSGVTGVRGTIRHPAQSEVVISGGGAFITSFWALDGGNDGIQGGFIARKDVNIDSNTECDTDSSTILKNYFVETKQDNVLRCYAGSAASWGAAVLYTVRKASGVWRAYRGSTDTCIAICPSVTFDNECLRGSTYGACHISAFEEYIYSSSTGNYKAKFNGAATPWQRQNSGSWTTIQSYLAGTNSSYWTSGGTFPNGLWLYTYAH
jgi:hypothetical protein